MKKTIVMSAALATMVLVAGSAPAALTAEQRCEAGKNDAAGKYAACAAKAERAWVLTGDAEKYAAVMAKCEKQLIAAWNKLEAAAAAAGTTCPSTGDRSGIEGFVDACVQSVASALAGDPLGPDPVTCASDLTACDGELTTCSGDLATTGTALTTCTGDLGTCNGSLTTCAGDLDTCGAGTAAAGDVLAGRTFSSAAGLGVTGTMANNAAVTLTPTTSDQAIAAGYHDGSGTCAGDGDLAAANIKNGANLFGVIGTWGGLPRTGQTSCYNEVGTAIGCAGSGQDGEFQEGVASAFTDNGDGTVTDNVTGLMWEKLSDDGTIHDCDNTYTWATAVSGKIATLNAGPFAGYGDWRLPNVRELETLKNFGTGNPATFSAFNSGCVATCTVLTCSCTRSLFHWSSSTSHSTPTYAWKVDFNYGYTSAYFKTDSERVRAVRAGY